MQTVKEFYKDQDIFITGGSGFMGKVLIEKLLRSCPDLNKIYVLIRGKKEKTAEERLREILNGPLFEIVNKENPNNTKKVVAVNGDVASLNLGIADELFQSLENVSVIFHAAASVRFDDPLKSAILLNTRGTLEVINLGKKLKRLKVLLHISTTYCNPDKHVLNEQIYPPYADWKSTVKIAEAFDTELLNVFYPKFSSYQPNTYTFTKSLAEHIINEYKTELPVAIFRPSIVVSTINDPIKGWIDNFNGPVGMLMACAIGILRTMHGDPNVISDFVPVDLAIKGVILAAYDKGMSSESSSDVKIYNCSTSSLRPVTTGRIIELAKEINKDLPIAKMLWIPGGHITRSKVTNFIKFMLFHLIAACFIDTIFRILNRKPFLLKLQRRIYAANLALHYFATTNWTFINNNFMKLEDVIPPEDRPDFSFLHLKDIDVKLYFYNAMEGARKYLLAETDEDLKNARIKYRNIYILDKILKTLFVITLVYTILKFSGI